MTIKLKTADEIEKMRVAGQMASEVLDLIEPHVVPGVTTDELNTICHDHIVNVQQAIPATLGYKGFTKSICHAQKLCDTAYESMVRGIEMVKPGATLGDVGHAIQTLVEGRHYSVVQEYCGHGIGSAFHEDPQVLHFGRPGTGVVLEAGMTFTIEPLSAQWEHTVLVTDTGYELLTLGPGRSL